MQRRFFFVLILIAVVAVSAVVAAQSGQIYTYTQKLTITEDGGEYGNAYGVPFDIDDDAAMITALSADEGRGAVYYYERVDGQWVEKQRLASDTGGLYGLPAYFDGNLALVSSSVEGYLSRDVSWGAVYAFELVNGVWVETQKLELDHAGRYFGWWLALQGDTALISYIDDVGVASDAVKVYEHQNGQWIETQTILLPDAPDENRFGAIPVLNGSVVWLYHADAKSILGYEKINNLWTHTITLDDASFSMDVNFWSEGDHLIGIESTENGTQAVAYHRDNGAWSRKQTLPVADTFDPALVYRWEWVDGEGDRIVLGGRIGAADSTVMPQTHFFSVWEYQLGQWQEIQRTEIVPDPLVEDYFYQLYPALSGNTVMVSFADDAVNVYSAPDEVTPTPDTPTPETPTPETPTPDTPTPETPTPETPTPETPTPDTPTPDTPTPETPIPETPTPDTPTPDTPTPEPSAELLVNGGFEADLNGWKLKNPTKDKVKCDKPEKPIAFEGACVFQFKGGAGENSKLQQSVDLAAVPVSAGDTLTLEGAVWAKGKVSSKVTLKVKYAALPKDKIVVNVAGATAKQWTDFSTLQPSLSVTVADVPTAIKVQIKNSSASGKVRYDALSLTHQSNALIPLGVPQ